MKVALVGPKEAGKTRLANYLAGVQSPSTEYDPTAAVRIMEFERHISSKTGSQGVSVELWDCSGDQKYESCWPAIVKDVHGVAVLFNPSSKAQANEVKVWCEWFCKNANLQTGQIVIFAYADIQQRHKPLSVDSGSDTVSVPIVNVFLNERPQTEDAALPEKNATADIEFDRFLSGLLTVKPIAKSSSSGSSHPRAQSANDDSIDV